MLSFFRRRRSDRTRLPEGNEADRPAARPPSARPTQGIRSVPSGARLRPAQPPRIDRTTLLGSGALTPGPKGSPETVSPIPTQPKAPAPARAGASDVPGLSMRASRVCFVCGTVMMGSLCPTCRMTWIE